MKFRPHFIRFSAFASLIIVLLISCAKDKTPRPVEPCDPTKVYFNRDIKPIIASNCAKSGCHDAITRADGVELSTYEGIMQQVKAGKADDSDLYEVITDSEEDDRMPPKPNTPLTATQINLIRNWINEGALNLTCSEDTSACDVTAISYKDNISIIINTNCLGCHNSSNLSGGISLADHASVQGVALSGKLYNAVAQNGAATAMPLGGKLSDCDIKKIKAWVDSGSLNN